MPRIQTHHLILSCWRDPARPPKRNRVPKETCSVSQPLRDVALHDDTGTNPPAAPQQPHHDLIRIANKVPQPGYGGVRGRRIVCKCVRACVCMSRDGDKAEGRQIMPCRAFLWSSICIIGWAAGMRSCGPSSLAPAPPYQPHPTVGPASAVAKRQCNTTLGWRVRKHNTAGVTNLFAPYVRLHQWGRGAVGRSAPH